MSLTFRVLYRNCRYLHNVTQPVKWNVGRNYSLRILASGSCYQSSSTYKPLKEVKKLVSFSEPFRQCSTQQSSSDGNKSPQDTETKKPGLIQRFKQMYRDYWYVLVPVHMSTSAIWFGSLYYAVRSGVDVVGMLESLGVSETIMKPLKESSAGYFALAFALYKLATPLRYAVTIGGTTYAIKRLTMMGWIKPVPSRERIKEMLQEKRGNLQDRFNESKQHYQTQMKAKHSQVVEEMKRYKSEMRNMKNKVKKM